MKIISNRVTSAFVGILRALVKTAQTNNDGMRVLKLFDLGSGNVVLKETSITYYAFNTKMSTVEQYVVSLVECPAALKGAVEFCLLDTQHKQLAICYGPETDGEDVLDGLKESHLVNTAKCLLRHLLFQQFTYELFVNENYDDKPRVIKARCVWDNWLLGFFTAKSSSTTVYLGFVHPNQHDFFTTESQFKPIDESYPEITLVKDVIEDYLLNGGVFRHTSL